MNVKTLCLMTTAVGLALTGQAFAAQTTHAAETISCADGTAPAWMCNAIPTAEDENFNGKRETNEWENFKIGDGPMHLGTHEHMNKALGAAIAYSDFAEKHNAGMTAMGALEYQSARDFMRAKRAEAGWDGSAEALQTRVINDITWFKYWSGNAGADQEGCADGECRVIPAKLLKAGGITTEDVPYLTIGDIEAKIGTAYKEHLQTAPLYTKDKIRELLKTEWPTHKAALDAAAAIMAVGQDAQGDFLSWGNWNKTSSGTDGDDTVQLGKRTAHWGGAGDDHIVGFLNTRNFIHGGLGDDYIEGGAKGDTLLGGIGDDTITGLGGADVIIGGQGDDLLRGGPGADIFIITGGTAVGVNGMDLVTDFEYGVDKILTDAEFRINPNDNLSNEQRFFGGFATFAKEDFNSSDTAEHNPHGLDGEYTWTSLSNTLTANKVSDSILFGVQKDMKGPLTVQDTTGWTAQDVYLMPPDEQFIE